MDQNTVQQHLNELTERLFSEENIVSIAFDGDRFIIRYSSMNSMTERSITSVMMYDAESDSSRQFPVEYETGPEIINSLGNVEKHKPELKSGPVETISRLAGGDGCQAEIDLNHYGTISFISKKIRFQTEGSCNLDCQAVPGLASNNHVIAASDQASPGQGIYQYSSTSGTGSRVAALNCAIPLTCDSGTDFATGVMDAMNGVTPLEVRGVGVLSGGIERPHQGQSVRKFGARTGYSTGTVGNIQNIFVGGRVYKHVFSVSPGFGCAGDSGSAIVDFRPDPLIVGIYSWSDDVPCENDPTGYFFSLVRPGQPALISTITNFEPS